MKLNEALGLSIVMLSMSVLTPAARIEARGGWQGGNPGGAPPQQRETAAPQEQAFRQQQQQQRAEQEQNLRAQEDAARAQQQQARQAQQEQARQAQDAMRAQQEQTQQAQRAQQEAARSQQEQAQRAQEEAAKAQQEQARQAQEAERAQQEQAQRAQQEQSRQAENAGREQRGAGGMQERTAVVPSGTTFGARRGYVRPQQPRPLTGTQVPINKAISMPVVNQNASASEQQYASGVARNLQTHLFALQGNQAPANYQSARNNALNDYFNNYSTMVNNQQLFLNRDNTFVNAVPTYQYPAWFQPQSGWRYANGFVLGNALQSGLDWLRWGWHPSYGPPPDGFVCADDYFPTPWIYVPSAGLWRQPGLMGWAPYGPPYEYTGPITVQTIEPRHIHVTDPYTNWAHTQVVNVVYMYDAFFYPDYDRWGYMNRHGYWIWVNM